jgi:hypothetical protein
MSERKMGENGLATRWQPSSHTLAVKQPHPGSQAATPWQSSSHTLAAKQPHAGSQVATRWQSSSHTPAVKQPHSQAANSQQPHAAKPTANSHTATLQQSISHTATQPTANSHSPTINQPHSHSHTLSKPTATQPLSSKHAHWGVDQEQVVDDEVRRPVGNKHVWPVAPMEDVGPPPVVPEALHGAAAGQPQVAAVGKEQPGDGVPGGAVGWGTAGD